jgi:hypothetical protein
MKYSASFRAFHPKKTAQEVIDQFGLQANFIHSVGSQRTTPKGTLLDGVYERTYVSFPLDIEENKSVEDFLMQIINAEFLDNEDYMNKFISSGGKLEFFLGIYCEDACGIELEQELIQKLAKKGVGVSLDIYGAE